MTQTNIAGALTWPKDTPVEIQATVVNVYDLAQGTAQTGRAWSRQDFEIQDNTGSIKAAWFQPTATIQQNQQVTLVGKVDEYQGKKKIEVKEVVFNAPVAAPPAAAPPPYVPPPAAPGPDPFPGLPDGAQLPYTPTPAAAPTAPQAAVQSGAMTAQRPATLTVHECLEVFKSVQAHLVAMGVQDERAVQAFAVSMIIGMQKSEINRELPPAPPGVPPQDDTIPF